MQVLVEASDLLKELAFQQQGGGVKGWARNRHYEIETLPSGRSIICDGRAWLQPTATCRREKPDVPADDPSAESVYEFQLTLQLPG
jgi:hypothetical protein